MKILIMADGLGPADARGTEIIGEKITRLAKRGLDVTVVSTLDHFRDKSEYIEWKEELQRKGVKIITVDLSWLTKKNRYIALGLSKLFTFLKSVQIATLQKPDIVHEYSSTPSLFLRTYLVALFSRARTVHTIITYNNRYLSRSFLAYLGNLLDMVILPSKTFSQNYTCYLARNKIRVISQGVDVKRFQKAKKSRSLFGIPPGKKTILFLGPPEKGKGLFLLLDAVPEILKRYPNAFFLFVFHRKLYPKEYAGALQKIRRKFSNTKTKYKVIESLVDVPSLLKSVDVVVLPQTNQHGTLIYPQTLLEAMAAGRKIVISKSPEVEEIVKNNKNGFLFKNEDTKSLIHSLNLALKASFRIGKKAQKYIKNNHSLHRSVDETIKAYQRLV